jgi:hypothetical protein
MIGWIRDQRDEPKISYANKLKGADPSSFNKARVLAALADEQALGQK